MVAAAESKALTIYERMPDGLAAVQTLGSAIAKSGMFGCGSIEQGQVLALECLARRMPPLTLAERYHVVQGKLMMKYDAMLAAFHELGGKHKIVSRTEDKAEIELTIDGQTHRESLTWEQAKQEKWPFKSDGKTLKDNWSTPRSRRQMLWARVVSEGVRAMCPGVNSGRYVAEEIDGADEYVAAAAPVAESNGSDHGHKSASVVDQAEAAAKAAAVEAEFERKPAAATTVAEPDLATDIQVKRIGELTEILQCGELINAALEKRKIGSTRSLKRDDAAGILAKLEAGKLEMEEKAKAAAESATAEPCGPATADQVEGVKRALEEFAQVDRAGYDDTMAKLKLWLSQNGKSKLADLDANQAAQLYDSIRSKSLPTFIRHDLEQHAAKGTAAEPSKN